MCAPPRNRRSTLYDEAKVPKFTLPEALKLRSGEQVRDARSWNERRRPEILVYETEVFGKAPAKPSKLNYEVKAWKRARLAARRIVRWSPYTSVTRGGPKMDLLIYLPAGAKKAVPVFLGLNFSGFTPWRTTRRSAGAAVGARRQGPAAEKSRERHRTRWQVDKILAAGYGLATVDYNEIEPDFVGGMQYGIRPLFFKAGQTEPAPGEWGAIAAWGWGASRAMDYLEKDKESMASMWRCSDIRGWARRRCGRELWIRDSRS